MYTKDFTGVFSSPATNNVFNKKKKIGYDIKLVPGQTGVVNTPSWNISANKLPMSSVINANAANYKPTTPQPDVYQPQPKQEEQSNDYYSAYTDALNKQNVNAQNRYTEQEKMAKQDTDLYNQQMERLYGQASKTLQNQIPTLQQRSETTQSLIRKGLENVNQQGTMAKGNIEDQTGTTLRSQAQSKREVDSKRNAIFAGNNATESFGVGGYQLEQANADNEFLREQNITKRERDNQLANVDTQLVSAQSSAEMAINDEVAKFEDAVRLINNTLATNEIEKKNAIETSYNNLRNKLFEIRDGYNKETATLYEKQLELMQTVAKSGLESNQVGDDKLSQEFILSGFKNPVTAYDSLYMQKNGGADKNKGRVVDAITRLSEGDIAGITGTGKFNPMTQVPGSTAQQTYNDWKNLQAMLSLESRSQLKGSGAISDFEAKVLERAANLGLDTNLSEEQFRQRLGILMNEINGGQLSGTQSSGNIIIAPDGQQVMIVD